MKKILALIMCALLMLTLAACDSGGDSDVAVTIAPEESASADNSGASQTQMPVISAESTALPDVLPENYSYTAFSLDSGFSMDVPSHWSRQPASKSVCFTEPVLDGAVPGRIVVTSKKLESVGSSTRENQLGSYFTRILGDFDTYEWSDISTDQPFLGDDSAHSVTYSGTRDGLSYKGYVILAAVNKTIYVYHFRCGSDAYDDLEPVMEHIRDCISLSSD